VGKLHHFESAPALLFVAATVAAGFISEQRSSSAATRTFMTPIIFHYACVLFLSLMALVPGMSELALAAFVTVVALTGIGLSVVVLIGVVHKTADTGDRFGYGALPLAAYAAGRISVRPLLHRPVRSRRRAGSPAVDQYPQRLGFNDHLCAAAWDRPLNLAGGAWLRLLGAGPFRIV
jgi:hypothetical protein